MSYYKICKYIYRFTKCRGGSLWWGYYYGSKTPRVAYLPLANGFKPVFPYYTFPAAPKSNVGGDND